MCADFDGDPVVVRETDAEREPLGDPVEDLESVALRESVDVVVPVLLVDTEAVAVVDCVLEREFELLVVVVTDDEVDLGCLRLLVEVLLVLIVAVVVVDPLSEGVCLLLGEDVSVVLCVDVVVDVLEVLTLGVVVPVLHAYVVTIEEADVVFDG